MNALDEALQAMDVVKFYCWEVSAINKIMKCRDDELVSCCLVLLVQRADGWMTLCTVRKWIAG